MIAKHIEHNGIHTIENDAFKMRFWVDETTVEQAWEHWYKIQCSIPYQLIGTKVETPVGIGVITCIYLPSTQSYNLSFVVSLNRDEPGLHVLQHVNFTNYYTWFQ